MAFNIVMKYSVLCNRAKYIFMNRNTQYINRFPYNLGYCHADDSLSFDCWNLIKALVWSHGDIAYNHTVGSYAKQDKESGLGDWDGATILSYCTDVSSDFSKVVKGEFVLTPDKGHAVLFVGDFVHNNRTYNTVECNIIGGQNGVIGSYIDKDGMRYSYKGGSQWGQCWKHGKMPWIQYGEEKKKTYKTVAQVVTGIINGDFGTGETRKEKLYRYFQDLVNAKLK